MENTYVNLYQAIAKVQQEIGGGIEKDSANPYFNSRYTSLPRIIELLIPVCAKNGISWIQNPVSEPNQIGIETIIFHTSGEMIRSVVLVPFSETTTKTDKMYNIITSSRNVAQDAGSIFTYLRRYSLTAIFSLIGDDDLDGNTPDQVQAPAVTKPAVTRVIPGAIKQPEVPVDPDFPESGSYVPVEVASDPKVMKQPLTRSTVPISVSSPVSLKTTPPTTAEHVRKINPTTHEGEQFGYAIRQSLDAMNYSKPASEKQIPFLEMLFRMLIPDADIRHEVRWDILGINDFKTDPNLGNPRLAACIKWLDPEQYDTGELTSKGTKKLSYTFPQEIVEAIDMACEPYKTL